LTPFLRPPPPPPPIAVSKPIDIASHKSSAALKPRITHPQKVLLSVDERKVENASAAGCLGCGAPLLVLLALLIALIPFVGWIISIGLLLLAFGAGINSLTLASGLTRVSELGDYNLEGDCPYCTYKIKASRKGADAAETTFHTCTTCKERVLVKDDLFFTIPKSYSESSK
jgi:DNA-directed RNA polymerase subunit RPC12/RpoP